MGEQAALTALVLAHQRSVYSLALRMLGTRDLAEDLTQEVFMQMNGNLQAIVSNRHLGFWLRQVTSNRAIDQLRRRARLPMASLDEQMQLQLFSPEQDSDPMLQRHLRLLLMELSPPARAVLLLRFQEDLDPTDIAQALDMPLNTVKSHLKRSLESMREKIAGMPSVRYEDNST
ncbi:MAG TPA: RNA polymerase sigma factor [Steroidobacteraceae bacterium]|jgi:RNA polymerase sigma-70 factor (ECF subfamily)|nr:RNA polymerase sigma factor [Steroidobacteraceae bacterium]